MYFTLANQGSVRSTGSYSEIKAVFESPEIENNPTLLSQGRANFSGRSEASSLPPQENKLMSISTSARKKSIKTFSIILPNLIHKSRQKNLNS